ncbi:hypothetical protein [Winogradskyella ouciana]|uniref:hypothetical protein n=1 Tax=Winogradskyella ouciana TaxID=2608631 RepID=UPI003D28F9E9
MKKIYLLLLMPLLLFTCDNEKKELMAEFNAFTKKSDSIVQVHNTFEATLSNMSKKHQKLKEVYGSMEIQDSTLLKDFEEQGLMLERHDAVLKSHAEVIEAHNNADPNFDDINTFELNEKIDKMKQWHERMKNDHEILKEEHKKMKYTYENIEKKLNSAKDAN